MPDTNPPKRRDRRPSMTAEEFADADLTPEGYAFMVGYVATYLTGPERHAAVEAARKYGYVR